MTSEEIREAFLRYFEERGHTRVPSSSLIPRADPTLLFTNAGMVQFKDAFLGIDDHPYRRATSSQKCVRAGGKHNDLEAVGRTARHHTFFEMLGNFSFGDYFKRDAISAAWEFVTKRLELPQDRLWITIYQDDDEAFALWREIAGVPAERIVRLGEKDNFWAMGDTGPCGPCSEMHYDRGDAFRCSKPVCALGVCDCDRWLEFWNLVFMQFDRDASGNLTPLPKPSIDTGMGLERVVSLVQGVDSNWETDLLRPIIARVEVLAGQTYFPDDRGFPFRVIADHARACAFLISDGAIPSNEWRGYVLRRILRRAVRYGRLLGLDQPFLGQVADAVIHRMGGAYPELLERRDFVLRVITLEEERFSRTLSSGLGWLKRVTEQARRGEEILASGEYDAIPELTPKGIFAPIYEIEKRFNVYPVRADAVIKGLPRPTFDWEDVLEGLPLVDALEMIKQEAAELRGNEQETRERLRKKWADAIRRACGLAGPATIAGDLVFRLYDTYGFPAELTAEVAEEHGLTLDLAGFEAAMTRQREQARAAARFSGERTTVRDYTGLDLPASEFLGYHALASEAVMLDLSVDGVPVEMAYEGQQVEIVLNQTPFYAERGGQAGDHGVITGHFGGAQTTVRVTDTQWSGHDLIVHRGVVEEGALLAGQQVNGTVDERRRRDIMRNHTGTHLLHAALRRVLGEHVQQAGSLVTPDRLRFDFSHIGAPTREELERTQQMVNDVIRRDWPVQVRQASFQEAVAEGALAFFDEKYGETVRIVETYRPHGDSAPLTAGEDREAPAFSKELCGGTHVARTGEIGLCVVVTEGSIGAGMRRIEAVTGFGAEELVRNRLTLIETLAQKLQTTVADLPVAIDAMEAELDRERRRAQSLERQLARHTVSGLLEQVHQVNGVQLVAAQVAATDADALREMADMLRDRLLSGVIVLGAVYDDRPNFLAMVTKDLAETGLHAGELVRKVAEVTGGRGGGRADMAQGGGRETSKLQEALNRVPEFLHR